MQTYRIVDLSFRERWSVNAQHPRIRSGVSDPPRFPLTSNNKLSHRRKTHGTASWCQPAHRHHHFCNHIVIVSVLGCCCCVIVFIPHPKVRALMAKKPIQQASSTEHVEDGELSCGFVRGFELMDKLWSIDRLFTPLQLVGRTADRLQIRLQDHSVSCTSLFVMLFFYILSIWLINAAKVLKIARFNVLDFVGTEQGATVYAL